MQSSVGCTFSPMRNWNRNSVTLIIPFKQEGKVRELGSESPCSAIAKSLKLIDSFSHVQLAVYLLPDALSLSRSSLPRCGELFLVINARIELPAEL